MQRSFVSWIFIPLITFIIPSVAAQDSTRTISDLSAANKIIHAFGNSFLVWDIPLSATTVLPAIAALSVKNKPFRIPPSRWEIDFSKRTGRVDTEISIGAFNPAIILGSIIFLRDATLLTLDLFDASDISVREYERSFVLGKSVLYTVGATFLIKKLTVRLRPDSSDDDSFFSGHASSTFAGFSFMNYELFDWINREYPAEDQRSKRLWLKIGSSTLCYGWSIYVAYSRMKDNKHFFGDVVMGAIVGTGISTLLYHLHFDDDERSNGAWYILPTEAGVNVGYSIRF